MKRKVLLLWIARAVLAVSFLISVGLLAYASANGVTEVEWALTATSITIPLIWLTLEIGRG